MDQCNSKQKAFAQRVYFDLKTCRKWPLLRIYFYGMKKWIFFVGRSTEDKPLTFVLPISNDEQLSVDDLFSFIQQFQTIVSSEIDQNIQSLLMAIIANDFTLAYFNFSSEIENEKSIIEEKKEITTTTNENPTWN